MKPITHVEIFMAAAAGEYEGELPTPATRFEKYLKKIIDRIAGFVILLTGKQDVLTFDSAPTQNSTNPVTSGGVYTALANVGSPTAAQVQTAVDNYLDEKSIVFNTDTEITEVLHDN